MFAIDRSRFLFRPSTSVAFFVLVAAFSAYAVGLRPGSVTAAAAVNAPPGPEASSFCQPPGPHEEYLAFERKRDECVGGATVGVRGWLWPDCITGNRTQSDGKTPVTDPNTYDRGECKGSQPTRSRQSTGEAIAQARAIDRFNQQRYQVSKTLAVGPDVQWEVSPPGSQRRIDILTYDSTQPNNSNPEEASPIELIELKGTWRGGEDRAIKDAKTQLKDYEGLLNGEVARRVKRRDFGTPGYGDHFDVVVEKCFDGTPKRMHAYTVRSVPGEPGVVLIDREARRNGCPEPPDGKPYHPGRDDDGNGNDDVDDAWDPGGSDENVEIDVPWERVVLKHGSEFLLRTALNAMKGRKAIFYRSFFATIISRLGPAAVMAGTATLGPLLVELAITVALFLVLEKLMETYVYCEPHLATLDGLGYDFQAVGEFHLLQMPETGTDIQIRFMPLGSDRRASTLSAVAFELGGSQVQLNRSSMTVLVDGEPVPLDNDSMFTLDDGSFIARHGSELLVSFADSGLFLGFQGTRVSYLVPEGLATRGLLGNHNGDPADDLEMASGEPIPANAGAGIIHGRYADSWRITDEESWFLYEDDESTETFTDRSYPEKVTTLGDFTAAEIEAATAICEKHGVTPGPQFDDCILDVALTGDSMWAKEAAEVTQPLVSKDAKTFDGSSLSEDFEGDVPANLDGRKYVNGEATTRVVGPFFDSDPYQFNVAAVPRHDDVTLRFDAVAYGPVRADTPQQVKVGIDRRDPVVVNLDGSELPPGAEVARVGSGTTKSGNPYRIFRVTVPVRHAGSSLSVRLATAGFKGLLDTAVAFDNVDLTLRTAAEQVFPLSFPGQVTPNVPGPGAGRLETPGAQDVYTWSNPADGASIGVAADNSNVGLTLRSASDGTPLPPTETATAWARFDDLPSGDYRLEVTALRDGSHNYSLGLRPIDPLPEASAAVDGEAVESVLASGQSQMVTFDGDGRGVRITLPSSTPRALDVSVTAPDGSTPVQESWVKPGAAFVLDPTQVGTYRILLDPAGSSSGVAAVKVESIADVPPAEITVDGPALATTFQPGQNRVLTFDSPGGRVALTVPSSTVPRMLMTVRAPDGKPLREKVAVVRGTSLVLEDTEPGRHDVLLDPLDTSSGTASLEVDSVADLPIAQIDLGGPPVSSTFLPGQNQALTFAAAGQRLLVKVGTATVDGQIRIIAPDGTVAAASSIRSGRMFILETTQTGPYEVFLDPAEAETGQVSLQVQPVAADVAVELAADSPPVTSTLASGQNAALRVVAAAGQRLRFSLPASTVAEMSLTVTGPDGKQKINDSLARQGEVYLIESAAAGEYVLRLDPKGSSSGTVSVQFDAVADVPDGVVPVDGGAASSAFRPGQNRAIRFDASAGQRLLLSVPSSTVGTLAMSLTGPSGKKLVGDTYVRTGAQWVIESAEAGTHVLRLDPAGTSTGTTAIEVRTVDDLAEATLPVDGAPVSSSFQSGQNRTLRFDAAAGQRFGLSVPSSTVGTLAMSLTGPDGKKVIGDTYVRTGSQWVVESAGAGTHVVRLDPAATSTGSAAVQLQSVSDLADGSLSVDGDPSSSTFQPGQNRVIRFSAVAGKQLVVRVRSSSVGSLALTVTAPDGSRVATDSSVQAGDQYLVEQAQAGTYAVRLDPSGTSSGSAALRVDSVPELPDLVAAVDGGPVSASLGLGQAQVVRFDATRGQRLLVQTPSSTVSSLGMTLIAPDGSKAHADSSVTAGERYVVESAQAGTHELRLDPAGAATGTSEVRVDSVTDLADVALPVDGDPISSTFLPGQNRLLRIDTAAGQRLLVTVPSSSVGSLGLTLTAPDGSRILTDTRVRAGARYLVDSAQPGAYELRLDPEGASAGTADVQVQSVADLEDGVLSVDGGPESSTFRAGQNRVIRFQAEAGQRLLVWVPSSSVSSLGLTLTQPGGGNVASSPSVRAGDRFLVESAVAGTYVLRLDPVGISSGEVVVQVQAVTDVADGQLMVDAGDVTSTFQTGQNRVVRFEATAAQRLIVRIPSSTVRPLAASVVGPDGSKVAGGTYVPAGERYLIESAQAGTYEVRLDPMGTTTGTVRTQVDSVSDQPDGVISVNGDPLSSPFLAGQNRVVRFDASPAQRLRLRLTHDMTYMGLDVTAPDGSKVVSDVYASSGTEYLVESALAGTYRVRLNPHGLATGSAALAVSAVADLPDGTVVVDGGPATSTFGTGQNRVLRFEAAAGQRLRLKVTSDWMWCLGLEVTAPDGAVALDRPIAFVGSEYVVTAAQAGTYALRLDPPGTSRGDAAVTLTSDPDVPVLS